MPPVEHNWTVRVWRWCGLVSNYINNLSLLRLRMLLTGTMLGTGVTFRYVSRSSSRSLNSYLACCCRPMASSQKARRSCKSSLQWNKPLSEPWTCLFFLRTRRFKVFLGMLWCRVVLLTETLDATSCIADVHERFPDGLSFFDGVALVAVSPTWVALVAASTRLGTLTTAADRWHKMGFMSRTNSFSNCQGKQCKCPQPLSEPWTCLFFFRTRCFKVFLGMLWCRAALLTETPDATSCIADPIASTVQDWHVDFRT